MAAAANIPALSSLLAQTSLADDNELLNAANAALKKNKNDAEAQHVRVIALLKLERFEDAVRAVEEGAESLKDRARLPWAYALYKCGRLAEAEEAAEKGLAQDNARATKHLLAQVTYRAEKFEKAAKLYQELRQDTTEVEDEINDLRINSGAVDAQLEWAGLGHLAERKKPSREDMEAFETAYNAACGSIARGELGQGEVLLKRAKDLLASMDDLTDDIKKLEAFPIIIQQVYLLGRLGRLEEAEQLCSSINISDITELDTKQIAQVNALVSTPGPSNPFLTHRLFHSSPTATGANALFSYQSAILRQDSYVIELQASKVTGVGNSTNNYLSKSSLPTTSPDANTVSVLNAAARARLQSGKAGINAIKPLLESRPNDSGLVLTLVQLYVQSNNITSAIETLEKFFAHVETSSDDETLKVRYAPGLIGVIVSLYSLQGRTSHVRSELAKAAKFWSKSSNAAPGLLEAAGESLLASDHEPSIAQARSIFETLYQRDPSNKTAVAGLVSALAITEPEKLSSDLLSNITAPERIIGDIDADALEAAGVPRLDASNTTAGKKRPADKPSKETARKAKKIRPSRMPKNYDPNRQPDPERWLPLRDRSTYRPKKKKGKGGATQGGTQGAAEEKGAAGTIQPAAGGGGGGGGGKKKKGGKKGKK